MSNSTALHPEKMTRTTLGVAGLTAVSRLLGFGRDLTIAYILGAGVAADVLVAVLRLTNFIRRLTADGCFSLPFIPAYLQHLHLSRASSPLPDNETTTLPVLKNNASEPDSKTHSQPGRQATAFARGVALWVLMLTLPLWIAAFIFPQSAVLLLAPGFENQNAELAQAAAYLRLLLPYALLLCLLAVANAVLQARQRFYPPALLPCIPNLTVLLVMLLAMLVAQHTGYNQSPRWPVQAASIFCQALLFSGLLQCLYTVRALYQENLSLRGPIDLKGAFAFMGKLPPSLCATASHQANVLLAGMGASFLGGGAIAQFHYADQLIALPLGLFGITISLVALPSLTHLAKAGLAAELHQNLAAAIRLALFLSLPAAAGLAALGLPLVKLLFLRGAFTPAAAEATALALGGATLCLPALAVSRPLLAAAHACGQVRASALAGLCSMIATALASLLLPLALPVHLKIMGIGLSVSLGSLCLAVALYLMLRRRHLAPPLALLRPSLCPLFLSLLVFATTHNGAQYFALHNYHNLLSILIFVPLGVLIYLGLALFFRCLEAKLVFGAFMRNAK